MKKKKSTNLTRENKGRFENEWFPVACDYTVDLDLPVKEGLSKIRFICHRS